MTATNGRQSLKDLLSSRRVIVCCGSGGVGKTTTSAALAMRAALEGKRAIVITIDPAKRLATSLGLKALSPSPTDLTENVNDVLRAQGEKPLAGKFYAVMPDTTQTFEHFVRSIAGKDETLAKRVLHTSIYKIFAKEYSGTNEYMAMEKLYVLYRERDFDLIVLDTPPAANTRAFLDAPKLLAGFFDDSILKWFIAPGSRFLASGVRKLSEILERLTGSGFVSDLIEFTTALFELRAQFMENLTAVSKLLHQSDVSFLMVTSPERLSKADTQDFVRLLGESGFRFWGFVVNRVLGRRLGLLEDTAPDVAALERGLAGATPETLRTLRAAFDQLKPRLEHEREAARFLAGLAGRATQVALVPEQTTDVHSVGALLGVSRQLD
ncbi:MAG: ArsA family ATPase [Deltaproteobacteria bacterium]|nr:ArsA family ATPase [Deltaproteobacteria bacterium]